MAGPEDHQVTLQGNLQAVLFSKGLPAELRATREGCGQGVRGSAKGAPGLRWGPGVWEEFTATSGKASRQSEEQGQWDCGEKQWEELSRTRSPWNRGAVR